MGAVDAIKVSGNKTQENISSWALRAIVLRPQEKKAFVLLGDHQREQYLFVLGLVVFHGREVSQISLECFNPLLFFSVLLRLLLAFLFQTVDVLVPTADLCRKEQQHDIKSNMSSMRFRVICGRPHEEAWICSPSPLVSLTPLHVFHCSLSRPRSDVAFLLPLRPVSGLLLASPW